MKTLIRILVILLVGILVAGGVYWLGENTSIFSAVGNQPDFGGGARPEGFTGPGQGTQPEGNFQPPAGTDGGFRGPGGDRDNQTASLSRGLNEIGATLLKIGVITLVVLAVQFVFTWLKKRFPKKTPKVESFG